MLASWDGISPPRQLRQGEAGENVRPSLDAVSPSQEIPIHVTKSIAIFAFTLYYILKEIDISLNYNYFRSLYICQVKLCFNALGCT